MLGKKAYLVVFSRISQNVARATHFIFLFPFAKQVEVLDRKGTPHGNNNVSSRIASCFLISNRESIKQKVQIMFYPET